MDIKGWLQQKTTIAGLSAIGGAATSYLSGAMTWQQAVGLAVGGLIATLIPEDTSTAQAVPQVVTALVTAVGDLATQKAVPPVPGTVTTTTIEIPKPPVPFPKS